MAELLVLRLVHILGGLFWVGAGLFTTFFLAPALKASGPAAGGAVMGHLLKRHMMTIMPIVALLTILSGIRLMWIVSAASPHWFQHAQGHTYSVAGALSIIAFLTGIFVVRPTMNKAGRLSQSAASDGASRAGADVVSVVTGGVEVPVSTASSPSSLHAGAHASAAPTATATSLVADSSRSTPAPAHRDDILQRGIDIGPVAQVAGAEGSHEAPAVVGHVKVFLVVQGLDQIGLPAVEGVGAEKADAGNRGIIGHAARAFPVPLGGDNARDERAVIVARLGRWSGEYAAVATQALGRFDRRAGPSTRIRCSRASSPVSDSPHRAAPSRDRPVYARSVPPVRGRPLRDRKRCKPCLRGLHDFGFTLPRPDAWLR